MDKLERIFQSIEFIENNLNREVSLKEVADQAYMSPYHFYRIFQAISGVNVGVYIRLRKLTNAAVSLTESSKRIIEISLESGYESQEAFTRAFKKQFRMTPAEFRKKEMKNHFNCRQSISLDTLKHMSQGVSMKPVITTVEPFIAVGLEAKCTQNNNGVAALWGKLVPRLGEIKNRKDNALSFGVCQYVDVSEFSGDTEFNEFVCSPVTSTKSIPEGMKSHKVDGGKFAVFTHKGSVEKLGDTYDYIYGSWMTKTELEIDERDDMEMYDHRFNPIEPEKSEMFIYIPIK